MGCPMQVVALQEPIAAVSSAGHQYVFTVFTPAYNRAHTLPRVFESLCAQTFRNFEWLLVDDGSTDVTRQLVEDFKAKAAFPIRYVFQSNLGKHVAFNRAVAEARGELFLTLDSDDACTPQALERLRFHWDAIPEKERNNFSAVTALCADQNGKVVGLLFPRDITDSNSIDIYTGHRAFGDKWGFQRTSILREFPFPEITGEKFIPEGIVWNRIALKYKTRFVNEVLKTCHYLADGLSATSSAIRARNPLGATLYYQEHSSLAVPFLCKMRSLINYGRFSLHAGIPPVRIVFGSPYSILTIALMPASFILFWKDRERLNRK